MKDILTRLYKIGRSSINTFIHDKLDGYLKEKEEEINKKQRDKDHGHAYHHFGNDSRTSHEHYSYAGVPHQVVEDLKVFNLTPPSSLEEVKKARNREIKKYHSDKFMNEPEKFETSKQIMQIYNAAYDRLKEYYEKGKG